jgi:hypothetical protein
MNAQPQRNEDYVEPVQDTSEEMPQDNRDSSIILNAVSNLRGSVIDTTVEWDNILDGLLKLSPTDPSPAFTQAAHVFIQNGAAAYWKSLEESQRKAIGDAVRDYHKSTLPIQQGPSSSSSLEPLIDVPNGNAKGLGALRESLEKAIFTEFVNAHEAIGDIVDKEGLMRNIQAMEDQDITDTVEAIRKACRDKTTKILMLDEHGNLMEGC